LATVLIGARVVLAAVFAIAGAAKLLDLPGSRNALVEFGVPARAVPAAAVLLPIAELATAIALVPAETARAAAVVAVVLLGAFILGIANAMRRGEAPDCHCFGQLQSAPAGRSTLARNAGLAALGIVIIADGPGPSISSWVSDRTGAELAAVGTGAAAVLLGAIAMSLWVDRRRLQGELEEATDALAGRPPGLPVGSVAPSFALADLAGGTQTLESLLSRGLPVVLAFVSPDCGPCQSMFPELGRWQASLGERLTVAAVSRGAPEDNRPIAEEHGISTLLLQENMEVMQVYRTSATPTLVVINADGTIGSPIVGSAFSIEPLIRVTLQRSEAAAAERSAGRA
jgi:thiol-disulfide isomerase/thioredoxin/uncharacterized membrane protein YphA (DoxX/SURF4 family)